MWWLWLLIIWLVGVAALLTFFAGADTRDKRRLTRRQSP